MFRNVFIGVDGTSHGRDAIALAAVLAEPGARLTLAHVQPGVRPADAADGDLYAADPTYYSGAGVESQELLEAERDATGVDAELITVAGPSVGPALHALAEERRADLLVVGACKHRLAGRILIGDDTRASVDGATCPVAIAPAGYAAVGTPPATIGVAAGGDSSGDSQAILAAAGDLAARHGSKIIAPAAAGSASGEQSPSRTFAELADEVDLLVVGSGNEGPLRRLLFGSASLRLARHVHGPILVIPRGASAGAPSDGGHQAPEGSKLTSAS